MNTRTMAACGVDGDWHGGSGIRSTRAGERGRFDLADTAGTLRGRRRRDLCLRPRLEAALRHGRGQQRVDIVSISDPAHPVARRLDLRRLLARPTASPWTRGSSPSPSRRRRRPIPAASASSTRTGSPPTRRHSGRAAGHARRSPEPRLPAGRQRRRAERLRHAPAGQTFADPEGSVSVIDLRRASRSSRRPRSAPRPSAASSIPAGVRIFGPGATAAQDLEPEYIAVDRTRARPG